MSRYGCFEIRTNCGNCGQSVPVNGPFREIICSSCYKPVRIPTDNLAGFFNDFDEEYPGYEEGDGSGGTLMGGGGTFEYKYRRLNPRCGNCRTKLPELTPDTEKSVNCDKCGTAMYVYPSFLWMKEIAPSAVQCISPERETSSDGKPQLKTDEEAVKPVVMSCPQCGGTLSITEKSERILKCKYCTVDVYIPDAVWARLHPVQGTEEWFIRFEGKTLKKLENERRKRDQKEERIELKKWRPLKKASRKRSLLKYILIGIPSFILLIFILTAVLHFLDYSQEEIENITSGIVGAVVFALFIFLTAAGALHMHVAFWFGKTGKCKKAMSELAEKHGWKHNSAEYTLCMGTIDTTYKGREFEIDPDDDYAIEVDLEDSPFYLKTEPPGYPSDGLYRFTTGNEWFDRTFPIRYAKPEMVKKMEKSREHMEVAISPIIWFLDRWGDRMALLKVDWSDIAVHLAPGHQEVAMLSTRYLKPEYIEPLLEDMITMAKAIDALARGKVPMLG